MRTTDLDRLLREADPAAATVRELAVLDDRARADLARALAAGRDADPPGRRPRRARPTTTRLLAAAAVAAVLVAGGGLLRSTTAPDAPAGTAAPSPSADPQALLEALGGSSSADYDAAATPAELAAGTDLVALGRFERFQPGRALALADGRELATTSTVLVLRDVRVVQGQLPAGSDGLLHVETRLGGEDALQPDAAAALPRGTEVLVYAQEAGGAAPGREGDVHLVDPGAGRPAGQPLYVVRGPQGLAVQAGDQVVWPALGEAREGTLAEALPDGDLIAP